VRKKTRIALGYIVAGATLASFEVIISPMIKSVFGAITGWFLAILVATVLGGIVAGKSI
jgi:hypothetical protein